MQVTVSQFIETYNFFFDHFSGYQEKKKNYYYLFDFILIQSDFFKCKISHHNKTF